MSVEVPTRHSIGITYNGQVRDCLPLSAGYSIGPVGISYTGKLCNTAATGFFGAYINAQRRIFYRFPSLRRTANGGPGRWVWTNRVI